MKKRKWHYILPPQAFECSCSKCKGNNLQWSEWEEYIWCYDCEIDFDPGKTEHAGIFSGPVPIQVSALFGLSFDRYLIEEEKIQRFNIYTQEWEDSWFFYNYDDLAKALLNEGLKKLDDRYGDISYLHGLKNFKSLINIYYRKMLYEILSKFKNK